MNESGDKTKNPVPIGQDGATDVDAHNRPSTHPTHPGPGSAHGPDPRSGHRSDPGPGSAAGQAVDTSTPVDATVRTSEHMFDDIRTTTPPRTTTTEGDDDDNREERQGQTQHLTLLTGGVRGTTPTPFGAPMPALLTPPPTLRDTTTHHQPLRRYQAPLVGSPVWSASAGWHDLTVRHDIAPPTTPLPRGWTRQWAITYRHGVHDYTASVATVGETDLFASDPIRRNSWHKNKTARAGLRFMTATGRHHAHESLFERKFLGALDFHGATDVLSQPFTLTWHDGTRERNHTPDFLVLADGRITVVNTRPAQLVAPPLLADCAAVAEVALSRGWDHALVVGYPTPAFTVIDTVSAHADTPDHQGYSDDILDMLDTHGPAAFADLAARCSSPVIARAVLQRLIWERQVSLDLRSPLEDHTLVALPGREDQS